MSSKRKEKESSQAWELQRITSHLQNDETRHDRTFLPEERHLRRLLH